MPDVTMWLMNTGYVGGDANDVKADAALKVKIRHSSAMLEALLSESVTWKRDPDFDYEIVDCDAPDNVELLSKVPEDILEPRRFYDKTNRQAEYQAWVADMKAAREQFLKKFDVSGGIIGANMRVD